MDRRAGLRAKISGHALPQREVPQLSAVSAQPIPGGCPRPYSCLLLNKEGDKVVASPCCSSWFSDPSIKTEVSTIEDVEAYWKGPAVAMLRKSVADGSYRHCSRELCPFLSRGDFFIATSTVCQGLAFPDFPGSVQYGLEDSCNLTCPSCRSAPRRSTPPLITPRALLQKGVRSFTANGAGEFLVSQSLLELARNLAEGEYPSLKEICLMTNGQLLSKSMWDSWSPSFKSRIGYISVSVDACTSEVYAKARRGGSFSRLRENLTLLKGLIKAGQLSEASYNFVLSADTMGDLPGFLRMAYLDGVRTISIAPLQDWGSMPPEEYRRLAVHRVDHPRHSEYLSTVAEARRLAKSFSLISIEVKSD